MTKRAHLWAWVNHAALNAGAAIQCCWHIVLSPQVDHSADTVQSLSKSNPVHEFLVGVGFIQ